MTTMMIICSIMMSMMMVTAITMSVTS